MLSTLIMLIYLEKTQIQGDSKVMLANWNIQALANIIHISDILYILQCQKKTPYKIVLNGHNRCSK
jgi:hypothetical protein